MTTSQPAHAPRIVCMGRETLLDQALRLPQNERLALADALVASAREPDPELTDEIRAMLDQAEHDAREHPERLVPWADVREQLLHP